MASPTAAARQAALERQSKREDAKKKSDAKMKGWIMENNTTFSQTTSAPFAGRGRRLGSASSGWIGVAAPAAPPSMAAAAADAPPMTTSSNEEIEDLPLRHALEMSKKATEEMRRQDVVRGMTNDELLEDGHIDALLEWQARNP